MTPDKYEITRRYIPIKSNTRPGTRLLPVRFLVAHDTGNPGATAANHYDYFANLTGRSASAHVFIDDKQILEIIPTGTCGDPAEKAWHVIYDVTTDNAMFGDDANDCAIGVELCFGGCIDFAEAYARYVWYFAYLCDHYGLDPRRHIVSHKTLDPLRKVDPDHALNMYGVTYAQFIDDVVKEKEAEDVALDKGVAQTIINTWMSPSWKEANDAGNKEQADYIHWLANELRKAAGLPAE